MPDDERLGDRPSDRLGYHHGDLRATLLQRAEEVVRFCGPTAVSLRGLARDTGVSHAAPAYHFGTRRGLLTALVAQGHQLLADAMTQAADGGSFTDVGVAYVRFAVEHPAHFAVMFRPDLVDEDDATLQQARARTLAVLRGGSSELGVADTGAAAVAAWSLVHGLATLHLTGGFASGPMQAVVRPDDVLVLARRALAMLFAPAGGGQRA